MLLQTQENLEELIVKVLAHAPSMSADKIRQAIAKDFRRYSAQAIFKELHKLQRVGVVVRVKRDYSLSMAWALDFVNLGDVIYDQYVAKTPLGTILPDMVKRKSWKCSDFCRVSNFWLHTKSALFEHTRQRLMYEWEPHPWVHLIHHEKQLALYRVFKRGGWHISKIVGGGSYLDRLYAPAWPKDVITHSFAPGPFYELTNTYLNVIGDYVFTIAIEPKHNRELEELYASMSSAKQIKVEKITDLLYRKAKFSVKLEENSKRAEQLRRQFVEYFGPAPRPSAP